MSNTTRQTSNSNDERYVMPLEASRRGAHRARVSPVMAVLPIVAVVGIVIGAIALVYLFFGGLGGSGSSPEGTASAPATTAPSTTASASASAPAPSTSAQASSTAPAGTVDKTITVSVYNGTRTSGLARRAGTKINVAGWTLGTVATWTGAPVTETTVYYGTDSQEATATAVAKALGHGIARLSAAKAGTGITVVVGPDFAAASGGDIAPVAPTHHSVTRTSSPAAPSAASSVTPVAPTSSPSPTN